ncbi:MAG TPA: hypothetical protein VNQ90_08875 [Chthoniobacteraceae bacterium]|nr:hypothetical protein [Chthoniobacteraceae bacterium]
MKPSSSPCSRWLPVACIAFALFTLFALPLPAAEFFVSPEGGDGRSGRSVEESFQTIQRGVDALAPGDTLTIAPGEYFGAVYRKGLGKAGVSTLIRASIPGTVVLRGDREVTGFEKVPDSRITYRIPFDQEPQAVYEVDTLTKLNDLSSAAELETKPGAYFYDKEAKLLYLSTTDLLAPQEHLYRVSVIAGHGFFLENPVGVKLSGLAATGFDSNVAYRGGRTRANAMGSSWGFLIFEGWHCTFENLTAYLNGGGIAFQNRTFKSEKYEGGGNHTIGCTAYANGSKFAMEGGDIATYFPNGDVIERCTSYLGFPHGIRLYQAVGEFSWIRDCFSRANTGQGMQTKGKRAFEQTRVERSITLTKLSAFQLKNSIIGDSNYYHQVKNVTTTLDNLYLSRGKIDRNAEFADPENFDFRLQSTSRFRNSGPEGTDRGTYPYRANIFYVKPDGDDSADGLSLSTAWKTAAKAFARLKTGDTLYFEPGEYHIGETALNNIGGAGALTSIRGRGLQPVVLSGSLQLKNCKNLSLERLSLDHRVRVVGGEGLQVKHGYFTATPIGLEVEGAKRLSVTNSRFSGFKEAAILVRSNRSKKSTEASLFLQSNQYENAKSPALVLEADDVVRYSGYNQFENPAKAWRIAGSDKALGELQPSHERSSGELFHRVNGEVKVLPARGAFGLSAGPHPPFTREIKVSKPEVRSVSATTVNLKWFTSQPASCEVAWGLTEACENRDSFDTKGFGSYSLTGLEPGQTYYFRIASVQVPRLLEKSTSASPSTDWKPQTISFTTAGSDPEPQTYYVSTQGDDTHSGLSPGQAWRHINHAAQQVAPGDTVIIESGSYSEQVTIPVTGEKDRLITFKAREGAVVYLDGSHRRLSRGFFAGGKSHLRFDGFRSKSFGLENRGNWALAVNGIFHFYHGKDIEITRCFNDGRGSGYSAPLVQAINVEDLLVRNCVAIANAGAIRLNNCVNASLENNVILRSNIQNLVLSSHGEETIRLRNNILGDNQPSKAHVQTFEISRAKSLDEGNNCYFFRIPDAERKPYLFGDLGEERRYSATEFNRQFGKEPSLVADPQFAGLNRLPDDAPETTYGGDAILLVKTLDFADFLPTNSDVIQQKIGLQPEAFGSR